MTHTSPGRLLRSAALIILLGAGSSAAAQRQHINEAAIRKLQLAELFVTNFYVDSISDDQVVDNAIEGILTKLDPHSTYIKAKDVERSTESLNGSFEGIGVQFNIVEDTLLVIQPVAGGPSEKKGIMAGDRIITVNDTAIAGVKMDREEIVRRLRGPKGTKVELGILRPGVSGTNRFTVTRDKIPVHTVDATYMVNDTTGYIRITSFGQTTHDEFAAATAAMRQKGMRALLLDLQGNGGGYLSAAVDMANDFLHDGDLIVYTDGRTATRQDFRANGRGTLQDIHVTVLVDTYTASAAEIVSGAIQDNDRGLVVGRRTFGKGLVQRPFELPDKSVIRLTVSHYYTPSGRCIQRPYTKGDRRQYNDDILHRLDTGELTSADSIHLPDSLRHTTLVSGRTVYGGGGIMPDIYVPLDTTQLTPLYRQLMARSCVLNTALKYADSQRRQLLKAYPTFADFRARFDRYDDLEKRLLDEARTAKVEITDSALAAARPMLRLQIQALVARNLWDMSEYFQLINPANEIYQRALQSLPLAVPPLAARKE